MTLLRHCTRRSYFTPPSAHHSIYLYILILSAARLCDEVTIRLLISATHTHTHTLSQSHLLVTALMPDVWQQQQREPMGMLMKVCTLHWHKT